MTKGEEYYINFVTSKVCRIAKAIHGEIVEKSTYEVGNTSCQCYQALHRGQCRHMKMRIAWIERGYSPKTMICDYDTMSFTEIGEDVG